MKQTTLKKIEEIKNAAESCLEPISFCEEEQKSVHLASIVVFLYNEDWKHSEDSPIGEHNDVILEPYIEKYSAGEIAGHIRHFELERSSQ